MTRRRSVRLQADRADVRLKPDTTYCGASYCVALVCLAAFAVLLAPDTASAQCAMCRTALQSPEGRQMVAAFRSGIVVLLAAPFSIFGVIAFLARRMTRRRASEHRA